MIERLIMKKTIKVICFRLLNSEIGNDRLQIRKCYQK